MRIKTQYTDDTNAAVKKSIKDHPNEFIRHRSQQLELCLYTLWKI